MYRCDEGVSKSWNVCSWNAFGETYVYWTSAAEAVALPCSWRCVAWLASTEIATGSGLRTSTEYRRYLRMLTRCRSGRRLSIPLSHPTAHSGASIKIGLYPNARVCSDLAACLRSTTRPIRFGHRVSHWASPAIEESMQPNRGSASSLLPGGTDSGWRPYDCGAGCACTPTFSRCPAFHGSDPGTMESSYSLWGADCYVLSFSRR